MRSEAQHSKPQRLQTFSPCDGLNVGLRCAQPNHPCQHGDRLRGIGPLCATSFAVDLARAATVAVVVAVAVKSPLMAPRRWCRNRIKKRPLSERSEFRTLPDFGASGVGSPRSGPPSPGSPFLAYVFWRSKRGRSAAGPRPGLVVRQDSRIASSAGRPQPRSRFCLCNGCTTQGALAARGRRVKRGRPHCRGDKPGLGPAADLLLLRRQEK